MAFAKDELGAGNYYNEREKQKFYDQHEKPPPQKEAGPVEGGDEEYYPADPDPVVDDPGADEDVYGNTDDPNRTGPAGNVEHEKDPATEGLAATIEEVGDYDPSRADAIAAAMLRNAGGGRAPTGAGAPQADMPDKLEYHDELDPSDQYLDEATLEDMMASGIGIGDTEVTTREVEDDELVEERLAGLLDEDSRYIRNARMRAMEQAQARGQFGSSFAAGAAERSAIEAAMPIATADAQAYRDAATQNMNALNSFALAHLNRATQLETSLLSANTQRQMANLDAGVRTSIANLDAMTKIDISNLDAQTRTTLANLQSATQVRIQDMVNRTQIYMQGKQMTHETGLENLRQQGRVELATMDAQLQTKLAKFAHEGRIELANLDHENRMELNETIAGYELEKQAEAHKLDRETEHANLAMQASMNYTNYVTAYANTDMDSAAAARLSAEAWSKFEAEMQMVNSLYPEFEPIVPERSQVTVGSGVDPKDRRKDGSVKKKRGG